MSSFSVVPAELELAGSSLHAASATAQSARTDASPAAGAVGAFAGQPAGGAYASACAWSEAAPGVIARARLVGTCVSAAGAGYLVTDAGVVPASSVPGAVGSSDPAVSSLVPINPAALSGMSHLTPPR